MTGNFDNRVNTVYQSLIERETVTPDEIVQNKANQVRKQVGSKSAQDRRKIAKHLDREDKALNKMEPIIKRQVDDVEKAVDIAAGLPPKLS